MTHQGISTIKAGNLDFPDGFGARVKVTHPEDFQVYAKRYCHQLRKLVDRFGFAVIQGLTSSQEAGLLQDYNERFLPPHHDRPYNDINGLSFLHLSSGAERDPTSFLLTEEWRDVIKKTFPTVEEEFEQKMKRRFRYTNETQCREAADQMRFRVLYYECMWPEVLSFEDGFKPDIEHNTLAVELYRSCQSRYDHNWKRGDTVVWGNWPGNPDKVLHARLFYTPNAPRLHGGFYTF